MGWVSYLRLPHLSGDQLCFVAEDDLWIAPLDGPGRARRLTVDRTKTGPPRFSPDGRHIAYTSWRTLVPEVHLVPVDGGPGRQLTHWGGLDTRVCGWSPPGPDCAAAVLAVASHGEPFSHLTWAHKVSPDGDPGRRLPWGPVTDIQVADLDGERRTLLLNGTPPHEPAAWKRYRGGATGRLWLHGEQLLPDLGGHLAAPMFTGGRIAFLSDHEGVGNLYSCAHDGTGLRRHTDHDAFYARNAASDGTRVVYQCAGDLWIVDDLAPGSAPRRLDVRLSGPRAGRRTYQVPAAQHVGGVSVDETGRASAVVVRGSLYWLTHRDGPAHTIADTPGVRVRLPEMLGESGRIAYVSDAEGEDAVEIAHLPRATGGRAARRLASGRLGRVLELVSDPTGDRLAVASHDGRLLLLDVTEGDAEVARVLDAVDAPEAETAPGAEPTPATAAAAAPTATPAAGGTVTELTRSLNGPVRDLAFSPDGAWLTWSHPGIGRTLRQIKMARIGGQNGPAPLVVDVTDGRFEDENPVFTRDGRYLAFLSWRGFDPVYDVHTGDLSFPLGCRPYLVPLSSATPSPFALNPEGRPAAGGLDPLEDESGEGGAVTVETEGLASRVTPFPVTASKYSTLCPVEGGGLVWLRWPISGALGETFANPADPSEQPTLEHFHLAKARKSELVGHLDWFRVSGDGSRLVVLDEGDLRAVPATEAGDGDSTTWIDLRRILHEADPAAEWRQAYEEAGRLTRAHFWDPGMCGIDWDAVLDQYRPLVERVASPDDFADLLREVLGELGTSHAYVAAARRNEGPAHYQRRQGLLGANFVCREGSWLVRRILPGDSSDSRARSPLAGTGIREGAVLTHVDGRPVDPVTGPFPLLAGAGGTTVELTFAPAEGGPGPSRRVAVVPLTDERPLRYQDWVAKRREVVRELSDGRCGYLHIPDMGGSGWAQFNRDLRMEVSRPALIVDVRGNAGGHISELVVEKLTRTILGWDLTRDAQPVSYASNAPRGPVVAVADEATSSDGDMITAAFKLLRLGPVVGQRTWGGVVGMTGRHVLGDGTVITVPMNAAWFDAYGWSVENYGVAPDVEALRTPLDWAEGRYTVLDEAVRLALELLAANPPATPPGYTGVPDRSRPPLPPRER
ncbi:PDZ domain-containing protein [Streptomyces olivaceus]|uniref:Tricorn protease homolog n=1 Tax=Streptomyces olivaceus TaxID=47716 RepID=A0ABS7WBU8_STROV|nr:S41 family peptidase [Streptomyces olivaceus]MBZ6092486.1 PDZ domain-containing protein [Streptomyces olivaceus]MBZ6099360.1 PDZ domain-containing protein [Streptomyces olivaceus]MBZ6120330.1 PDZ domain-containing protein [Streptomyces olivaceus]MBZ6155435.1 PDZ domain-containing protein [Streptomyces olivaceus]MBZ6197515.1 PDZ domain-containing protein [Streptomyces olivaceus]